MTNTNITIIGSGYVGMSLAVMLAQHNKVKVLDIDPVRVDLINKMKTTIADKDIEYYLSKKKLSISATLDKNLAYKDADYVIIATPTNYDSITGCFKTSSLDEIVQDAINMTKDALVVIKSTLPIGHTKLLQESHNTNRIIFSPEFLREGSALKDNLYPSRIIIGGKKKIANSFAKLLSNSAIKKDIDTLFMSSTEAESVKLFANTFLAMRISFFNELDSFALSFGLDSKNIINGVCLDSRINKGYNNPSFGYGGYCLPKDTKQLLANFHEIPQTLMQAIITSNDKRKRFITDQILELNPKTVGFFRLVMKKGSDNFRDAAIKDIINAVKEQDIDILIYEPELNTNYYDGINVLNDLDSFKTKADLIVTNRREECLKDVDYKVYSRDIFGEN